MQKDQHARSNLGSGSIVKGTDAQKVKQDIQKDVSQGQGSMTSREAGAMRD
ncbi:hypothetical protein [Heyndrickxia acidicola]|uniref:Uncharacterized protein n=1 Tax=Heyndrickxia acidicola TaxID=209389 RepID=A0ABU6MM02_9BACI|nr:hypothetical protein [Heyndrickxia acidicola]MED1205711.1 hypothetical protein [Heyndrickxia acidicola]